MQAEPFEPDLLNGNKSKSIPGGGTPDKGGESGHDLQQRASPSGDTPGVWDPPLSLEGDPKRKPGPGCCARVFPLSSAGAGELCQRLTGSQAKLSHL